MKAIGWIVVSIAAYLFLTRRQQLDFSIPATQAGATASGVTPELGVMTLASSNPGVDAAASGDTGQAETPIVATSPDFQLPIAVLPSSGYAPKVNWLPALRPSPLLRLSQ